jgi:N-methylhydantoinase A
MPVQGVTYRVHATVPIDKVAYPTLPRRSGAALQPTRTIPLSHLGDGETAAGEYHRAELLAGDVIEGPAVIREPMSTTHVRGGQVATIGLRGEIVIRRA